ncbi:MAG: zf-HC2 domain-containing protein [Proteobacteria bacterium]|nr:zf-HC2 domain-containing protein [Pseudomonadota bacterium]
MKSGAPVNCHDFEDRVHAFLDDELPDTELAAMRGHLGDCPRCEKIVTGFQKTGALISTAVTEMVTAVDVSGIWQAVESGLDAGVIAAELATPSASGREHPAQGHPGSSRWDSPRWDSPRWDSVRRVLDSIATRVSPGNLGWAGAAASVTALAMLMLLSAGQDGQVGDTGRNVTVAQAAGLKSARLDSLSGAPGYTVSSWVQPRTKARVIWVDNGVNEFASRDARY